jgi:hypothetical protein
MQTYIVLSFDFSSTSLIRLEKIRNFNVVWVFKSVRIIFKSWMCDLFYLTMLTEYLCYFLHGLKYMALKRTSTLSSE